jgi:hypothetical protein
VDFDAWQSDVNTALLDLLGETQFSRSRLESGLVVWRLLASGTSVTAGPEDHSGLVYLSFSDGRDNMMVKLEGETERAARYIATRLAQN